MAQLPSPSLPKDDPKFDKFYGLLAPEGKYENIFFSDKPVKLSDDLPSSSCLGLENIFHSCDGCSRRLILECESGFAEVITSSNPASQTSFREICKAIDSHSKFPLDVNFLGSKQIEKPLCSDATTNRKPVTCTFSNSSFVNRLRPCILSDPLSSHVENKPCLEDLRDVTLSTGPLFGETLNYFQEEATTDPSQPLIGQPVFMTPELECPTSAKSLLSELFTSVFEVENIPTHDESNFSDIAITEPANEIEQFQEAKAGSVSAFDFVTHSHVGSEGLLHKFNGFKRLTDYPILSSTELDPNAVDFASFMDVRPYSLPTLNPEALLPTNDLNLTINKLTAKDHDITDNFRLRISEPVFEEKQILVNTTDPLTAAMSCFERQLTHSVTESVSLHLKWDFDVLPVALEKHSDLQHHGKACDISTDYDVEAFEPANLKAFSNDIVNLCVPESGLKSTPQVLCCQSTVTKSPTKAAMMSGALGKKDVSDSSSFSSSIDKLDGSLTDLNFAKDIQENSVRKSNSSIEKPQASFESSSMMHDEHGVSNRKRILDTLNLPARTREKSIKRDYHALSARPSVDLVMMKRSKTVHRKPIDHHIDNTDSVDDHMLPDEDLCMKLGKALKTSDQVTPDKLQEGSPLSSAVPSFCESGNQPVRKTIRIQKPGWMKHVLHLLHQTAEPLFAELSAHFGYSNIEGSFDSISLEDLEFVIHTLVHVQQSKQEPGSQARLLVTKAEFLRSVLLAEKILETCCLNSFLGYLNNTQRSFPNANGLARVAEMIEQHRSQGHPKLQVLIGLIKNGVSKYKHCAYTVLVISHQDSKTLLNSIRDALKVIESLLYHVVYPNCELNNDTLQTLLSRANKPVCIIVGKDAISSDLDFSRIKTVIEYDPLPDYPWAEKCLSANVEHTVLRMSSETDSILEISNQSMAYIDPQPRQNEIVVACSPNLTTISHLVNVLESKFSFSLIEHQSCDPEILIDERRAILLYTYQDIRDRLEEITKRIMKLSLNLETLWLCVYSSFVDSSSQPYPFDTDVSRNLTKLYLLAHSVSDKYFLIKVKCTSGFQDLGELIHKIVDISKHDAKRFSLSDEKYEEHRELILTCISRTDLCYLEQFLLNLPCFNVISVKMVATSESTLISCLADDTLRENVNLPPKCYEFLIGILQHPSQIFTYLHENDPVDYTFNHTLHSEIPDISDAECDALFEPALDDVEMENRNRNRNTDFLMNENSITCNSPSDAISIPTLNTGTLNRPTDDISFFLNPKNQNANGSLSSCNITSFNDPSQYSKCLDSSEGARTPLLSSSRVGLVHPLPRISVPNHVDGNEISYVKDFSSDHNTSTSNSYSSASTLRHFLFQMYERGGDETEVMFTSM